MSFSLEGMKENGNNILDDCNQSIKILNTFTIDSFTIFTLLN